MGRDTMDTDECVAEAGARQAVEARLARLGEQEMDYVADRMSADDEAWWTGRWRVASLRARLRELTDGGSDET